MRERENGDEGRRREDKREENRKKNRREKRERWEILKRIYFFKSSCHIIYLINYMFKFNSYIS